MPRSHARGLALRGRLVLLFLLALLPAFAATLYTSFEHRRQLRTEAEQTTVTLARLTAAHIEGTLAGTYQLLRVLDDDPLILAGGRTCEARFEHVLATARHNFTAFAYLDPTGALICSSPRAVRTVTMGHPLFKRLQRGEEFSVGAAEFGPITGKPVVIAAQALRERGELSGVVAVGLDLRSLGELTQRTQLPPQAVLMLLNVEGSIMVRYPDPAKYVGHDVRGWAAFPTIARSDDAGIAEGPAVDARPRIWAYAPLEVGGRRLFTAIGVSAEPLLAHADHVLWDSIGGFFLAAAVALLLAALAGEISLRRPIERMRQTAAQIAGGDLTARVALNDAPGELGGLARAIDEMAEGLQSREQRLASLSRRVLDVQEVERRGIARELHDEIGQSLTAIKLMLQRHRQAGHCQETATIDDVMMIADRTLQQVRGLSLDLRPSMLDHLGLPATLRWYVDREAERSGYVGVLNVEPEGLRLSPERETTLFRIAQEALTNVTRHSGATSVEVTLTSKGGRTELSIRDNGRGFEVDTAKERARRGESLGLLGMEERAALDGGTLRILSGPSGTEVRAVFPWGESE